MSVTTLATHYERERVLGDDAIFRLQMIIAQSSRRDVFLPSAAAALSVPKHER